MRRIKVSADVIGMGRDVLVLEFLRLFFVLFFLGLEGEVVGGVVRGVWG